MRGKLIVAILSCALLLLCACEAGNPFASNTSPAPLEPAGVEPVAPEPTPSPEPDVPALDLAGLETYDKVASVTAAAPDDDVQADVDIHIDIVMEMTVAGEKETFITTMSGNMKFIYEGDVFQYAYVTHMTIFGDFAGNSGLYGLVELYHNGERGYYAINGNVIDMSDDELFEQLTDQADLPDFPESGIRTIDVKTGGGYEVTTIVVDGNELTDYIIDTAGGEVANLAESDDLTDIAVEDVEIVVVALPDGTPVSVETEMVMYMTIADDEVKVTMTMKYVFLKYGSGVEIDLSKIPNA